jgi:DNA ligase-1
LSEVNHWLAEWQWGGLRVQAIRRGGQVLLWSCDEELFSARFPELATALLRLPDGTVLDGEILAWEGGAALPRAQLARRLSRKTPDQRTLSESPVAFLACDLLEHGGQDVRAEPLRWRREALTRLLAAAGQDRVLLSPTVEADSWQSLAAALAGCRERHAEGLLLRRLDSPYWAGPHPDWRIWTNAPFTAQAVLIYAQRGAGPRPDLHAEYTFGVWENGALVPIAKTGAGLAEAEIEEIDAFVRANTLERFGPVRTVRPELVFELAFESIHHSARHKSGLAVRAPRILRRRSDLRAEQAATLAALRALLPRAAP